MSTPKDDGLVSTAAAAALLGISDSQFRRLMQKLKREPDGSYTNPHYRSGPPALLWSRKKVLAAKRLKTTKAVIERARKAAERAEEVLRIANLELERSKAALRALDDAALMEKALLALHALNREAKHRRRTYFADVVYAAKDRLLDVLLRAGHGKLETFEVPSRSKTCDLCGHTWVGDYYCNRCDSYDSSSTNAKDTWYVVEVGGHRFHRPRVDADLAASAVQVPPHEPTQPPREVPDVGMTEREKFLVIDVACERFRAEQIAA